jgi:hypothetical protein
VRLVGPYALNTKINNKTNFLLGFGPFLKTKKWYPLGCLRQWPVWSIFTLDT